VKSSGERLSDRITIGVLTRTFPPELIDEVLVATGRVQQRSRLLPSRVVVYFVLAMCLFFGHGYEEVLRLLTQGLPGQRRWQGVWQVPTSAAIWKARVRVGVEPLRALFDRVCRPVADPDTAGAFYRRWRLVAVDGTTFNIADTVTNAEHFGRPGSARGEARAAYPQARMAVLAECGTHTVFAAAIGPLATHERVLTLDLLPALSPGMLLLADRGFPGYDLWQAACATGADLLWRVRTSALLPLDEQLPDGSYLSNITSTADHYRRQHAITVRVVEYSIGGSDTVYRLLTTILDHTQAPADELAAAYAQRWEIESTLDELKTHQGGPGLVLRSQHPLGVEQELYGLLLSHHAIRSLMHHAAVHAEQDPDRMSFTRTLNIVRRQVTAQAAFSPRQTLPRDDHDVG
jgi:hypothetical protein